MKPDLTYSTDDMWTRFYPETDAGADAWRVMADADPQGVVAFLPLQVPSVLAQLRKAGLRVRKAKSRSPLSTEDLDVMLAELDMIA